MDCLSCLEKDAELKRLRGELELSRYQVVAAVDGKNKLLEWASKVVRGGRDRWLSS